MPNLPDTVIPGLIFLRNERPRLVFDAVYGLLFFENGDERLRPLIDTLTALPTVLVSEEDLAQDDVKPSCIVVSLYLMASGWTLVKNAFGF